MSVYDNNVKVDASGNVEIAGNLTVNGATNTINTTNTVISDKLIELGNGVSGTPSGDAGFIIERGSSTNAGIIWDETRDEFVVCTTSATGASTGDLTFTPANLSVERIGAGTEQAEVEVHAKRDASSGGTYSTTATIISEDDTRPSIQLVGSANNIGLIQFGDNAAAAAGMVYYDHSTDKLRVDCGGNADRLTVDASGNAVTAGTVTATGFTIGSAVITETELEVLDGATLSTTELNYVDGVTSAIQTQLDGKSPVAGHSSIATVGTVGTGTWQGTAVASQYLDADTAHLSGTQTFTGAKTFSADVVISGTTPQLTIGDAGAEDTMLLFDGAAQDFRVGLDDGTDKLEVGVGSTMGTTTAFTVESGGLTTFVSTVLVGSDIGFNEAIADEKVSGITAAFTAGEALVAGEVCYFKAGDSKMWKAVATAAATSRCVAMVCEDIAADATGPFLLQGFLRNAASFPSYTIGGALYTPEAEQNSENVPEQAAPDSDGDFVQVIGWAVSADMVYFNPSNDIIEVA